MRGSPKPTKRRPPRPAIWLLPALIGSLLGSTACTRLQVRSCTPVPHSLTQVQPPQFKPLGPHASKAQQMAELDKTETDRRRVRRRLAVIDAQQQACR